MFPFRQFAAVPSALRFPRLFSFAAFLLFVPLFGAEAAWPKPAVRPPADHPRVLLRPSDLAAVRASRNHPAVADLWTDLKRRTELPKDFRPRGNDDPTLVRAAEATAFLAMVENNADLARQAHRHAVVLLSSGGEKRYTTYAGRISLGRSVLAAACVYDWCHDFLHADELAALRQLMLENASHMEIGFPPVKGGSITTHGSGTPLLRDQLALSIAVADEAPEIYDMVAGRFYAEYVAPRQFTYGGHFNHQGSAYGLGRFSCDAWAATLITRMGAPAPWPLQDMAQVPYYFLYLRRPDGGLVEDGDDYLGKTRPAGSYWTGPAQPWLLFVGLFQDPQFAAEWRRHLAAIAGRSAATEDPSDPILAILFRPDRLAAVERTSLPTSRYFPEPAGALIARTGWTVGPESSDAVAYLKIGTHRFDNHQHADSGQFQLYYRGSLAIDSGIYESADTGYGQPHHRNYARRTIAHNTLLIEEPKETFTFNGEPIANDGGQRVIEGSMTMEEFWKQSSRTAHVLAHYTGPSPGHSAVSLIKGDLTPAYSSDKARRVVRTMVFLTSPHPGSPGTLIVKDDVNSVRADQRQVSLLHSLQEPQIDGQVVTIASTAPQREILRATAKLLPTATDRVTLIFGKMPPSTGSLKRAELWCPLRWDAGKVAVSSAGRAIGSTGAENVVADVTAFAAEALKTAQPLSFELNAVGAEAALKALSGPEAPHLRLWYDVTPARGKLVQTTLLPAAGQSRIAKVGGPELEFVSGGKNWPATAQFPAPEGGEDGGAWRVETSLATPAETVRFLQVYQLGEADAPLPAVRQLRGSGATSVSVSGRVLLLSSDSEALRDGSAFEIAVEDADSATGLALTVLSDLPAGDHSLWQGEKIVAASAVEAPAHTWVVPLRPGSYTLRSKLSGRENE